MAPKKTRKAIDAPHHAHALTFSTYGRRPHLLLPGVADLFLARLDAARSRLDFDLWAYVVMPEHVHVVLRPRQETYAMARIMEAIKGPFAKAAFALRPGLRTECHAGTDEYRFWQAGGGYDRNLFTAKAAWSTLHYVHMNPVARGLCEDFRDWPWSSARAYQDEPTPILVDLCDWHTDG